MSQDKSMHRLQRFLVYVLRHHPQELRITLKEDGFVKISEILAGLSRHHKYSWATEDNIRQLVREQPNKKRLEIKEDQIRACYGHSGRVIEHIKYVAVPPPDCLYHGTPSSNIASIQKDGLVPGSRSYVHLSDSEKIAQQVGSRHSSKIIILKVKCQEATQAGIQFFRPEPQIWLVKQLPPEYIEF